MQTVLCVEWLLLKCKHSTLYHIETIFFLPFHSLLHPFTPLFTPHLLRPAHSLTQFFSPCEHTQTYTERVPQLLRLLLLMLMPLSSPPSSPLLVDILSNKICISALLNACTAHVKPMAMYKGELLPLPPCYTPLHTVTSPRERRKNKTTNSLLVHSIYSFTCSIV